MFTKNFLMKEKFDAMKTKNTAKKNVVMLALGDLNTASIGLENAELKVNGKVVSEEKFLELNIAKQMNSLIESINAYKKRGDVEKVPSLEEEVKYIKEVYFPPLSSEEVNNILAEFKKDNPGAKTKEWMTFLLDNYYNRYDGASMAQLFNKK